MSVALADSIDNVRADILNTVRYQGFRCFTFSVHWAHPPDAIAQTVTAGPNASSAPKQTPYPIDSVEMEVLNGRSVLSVCAALEASINVTTTSGWANAPAATDHTHATTPAPITRPT